MRNQLLVIEPLLANTTLLPQETRSNLFAISSELRVLPSLTQVLRGESGRVRRLTAKCRFCGERAAIEIRGKGPHKGEYCSSCGHWLRWIPKKVAKKRVGT